MLVTALGQTTTLKTLTLSLLNNKFNNYDQLESLSKLTELQLLNLELSLDGKIDYSFVKGYNKMLKLTSLTVDAVIDCKMDHSYMFYKEHLECKPCKFQCQKCFGDLASECVSCIPNTQLKDTTCEFSYSDPKNLQFDKLNIQDSQFSTIVEQIHTTFVAADQILFNVMNNNLSDFTPLSVLGDKAKMGKLKNITL